MSHSAGSKLIYVVDDKPALVDLAKIGLEMAGYTVRGFNDPQEVIDAIRSGYPIPDILITDFDMPKMNGLELVRECRALQPALRTIMVSGTVQAQEILSNPIKVNRFLAKPYNPTRLNDVINDLLSD